MYYSCLPLAGIPARMPTTSLAVLGLDGETILKYSPAAVENEIKILFKTWEKYEHLANLHMLFAVAETLSIKNRWEIQE